MTDTFSQCGVHVEENMPFEKFVMVLAGSFGVILVIEWGRGFCKFWRNILAVL